MFFSLLLSVSLVKTIQLTRFSNTQQSGNFIYWRGRLLPSCAELKDLQFKELEEVHKPTAILQIKDEDEFKEEIESLWKGIANRDEVAVAEQRIRLLLRTFLEQQERMTRSTCSACLSSAHVLHVQWSSRLKSKQPFIFRTMSHNRQVLWV